MEIHKNKYEYSTDKGYIGYTDKIRIVDRETNDTFFYRVDRHLSGIHPNKVTLNQFKIKSSIVHNSKYDYSLITNIKSVCDKVEIICSQHGVFKQRVSNHMYLGDRCPKCVGIKKWDTESLKNDFDKVHNGNYDYSMVEYVSTMDKVRIVCRVHGEFKQNINKHLYGQGCRSCKNLSKGEEYIKNYLDTSKIKYIRQHGFDGCRYINKLSFDFYLPDFNTCVEFDGIQHFKPVDKFGGMKSYIEIIKRDECKNKWCFDNNISLIRIKNINEVNYKLNFVNKK